MFTTNWFEQVGRKNFENNLRYLSNTDNLNFLEIGCFEGAATSWMLNNVLVKENSKITVIDTFEGSVEHHGKVNLINLKERFLENVQQHIHKVNVIVGKSQQVLRTLNDQYDFIYIDGSHVTSDVLEDAILAYRLLKYNGILAFDDYFWDKIGDELDHPQIAIDSFITIFANKFEIISKNYQIFLRRIDKPKFIIK